MNQPLEVGVSHLLEMVSVWAPLFQRPSGSSSRSSQTLGESGWHNSRYVGTNSI